VFLYSPDDRSLSVPIFSLISDLSRSLHRHRENLPVFELSNHFSPIPFLIKQRRFRLNLTCNLPQNLTPVVVYPFLINQNAAISLDNGVSVLTIEWTSVFCNELVGPSIVEV
jgi:hypothetical protein